MKITFVIVSPPAAKLLPRAACRIERMVPGCLELRLHYVAVDPDISRTEGMVEQIADADAVFLDLMGASPRVLEAVDRGCARCAGQIIPFGASSREYLRLGAFSASSMKGGSAHAPSMTSMRKMQGMAEGLGRVMPGRMRDMRNYSLLMKYFQNTDEDNLTNLLILLLTAYGGVRGLPKPLPPHTRPAIALYDMASMTAFDDRGSFERAMGFSGGRPGVALLFTAYAYPTDTLPLVRAIVDKLGGSADVYPVGITSGDFHEVEPYLRAYLLHPSVDLVLDCEPFRLAAGPMGGDADAGVRLLEEVDATFLHPFFLTRRTMGEWRGRIEGCTPNEVLISIMLPELDGAMETVPVGVMADAGHDDGYDVDTFEMVPIPERLERLKDRVDRHLALRRKDNAQKRIALIAYDYPPGEANIMSAAFLDTFGSLAAILARLEKEGYDTRGWTVEQLAQVFRAGHAVNSGRYETDADGLIHLPVKDYEADPQVTDVWGAAPGDIMTDEDGFIIPGVTIGNVFVGLQPARSRDAKDEASYHDKTLPPHHQYVAFYRWIHDVFQADAIVHVGTHGTLEFLKGKESGMSGECWPDRLISDLPHIYLYYCGNPSEATIAKRRSCARVVSYQPPVFVKSGLYGQWLDLSTMVEDYRHLAAVSPDDARASLGGIMQKAGELGLPADLDGIERELYRMQGSLIPKGLHVFGTAWDPEELESYAQGVAALRCGGQEVTDEALEQARIDCKAAAENHEMDGLVAALDDRFTSPHLAGDIFRNPQVMPTGYNLYQFDPRLVPSESAMRRGREVCDNTLAAYRAENGDYPQSVAVIAWGLEASRTQGETIGQVLAYLGVRMDPESHVWDRRFQIIPPDELGRPRIDVTINICGFFRDMFGTLIELLDDLFMKLYELDESDEQNRFKADSRRHYDELVAEGYDETEARRLAVARIFGPRAGEYGTDLTDIIDSKDWEDETQLGTSFTASLRYAYGRDMDGREAGELYRDNLKCVDVVSQLRSDSEYEITDLDHYYEFFGGLAKSVEMARGSKACMYITDTTGGQVCTDTVDASIARGLATRVLNPQWIDGMLAHRYHGAQKVADRFQNVMGLAATTGAVDQRLFDDLEERYVEDEDVRRRMAANNPHAYLKVLEQMMEYDARGYWDATEEQLDHIRQIYRELEDDLEAQI